MKINIDDLEISYNQYGQGEDIVLLHGWGQNKEMMDIIGKEITDKYRITSIDLPGFGKSEIHKPLNVYEYAEIIYKLITKLKLKDVSLIGHSFGGKIAIVYASKYPIKKLVLLASPIYASKIPLTIKIMKKFSNIKFLSKIKIYLINRLGSVDYKNANSLMKETLKLTVNLGVENLVPKIKSPTLLIWGIQDQAVDIADARRIVNDFKDGALIELRGTHYAYLENLGQVCNIIGEFI